MSSIEGEFVAIQSILGILSEFDEDEQKRVVQFVLSKLNITSLDSVALPEFQDMGSRQGAPKTQSLKLFLKDKKMLSDVRFAVCVAYYFKYVAPDDLKKDEIGSADFVAGCEAVDRKSPDDPGHALRDAKGESYLKSTPKRGLYTLDHAGEELMRELISTGHSSSHIRKTK